VERIKAVIAISLDLSYQNECVPHQDSGQRDQAKDGIEAEGLMEDEKDWHDSHQAEDRWFDDDGRVFEEIQVFGEWGFCWGRDSSTMTPLDGGPAVKEFEQAWREHFRIKHAVTVNSCTSGLIAAVGAIGTQPGDEIIVSPWTMCASATAILHWNAIPVLSRFITPMVSTDCS